ncbi:MAG: 2-oxo acid dehydrogenase subunit E2 [Sedimentisphaerales bacterium]|nr:2-oxo acid dehydrogenase subunit E2 [Sedimentisphaerales bacterium]
MIELRLPNIVDQGLNPLVLAKWAVRPGQDVAADEIIASIEAPGAIIELRCSMDGTIQELLANPGQVLQGGQAICTIGPKGQKSQAPARPVAGQQAIKGRVIPILMPQAGQTMEEGTILAWKVKEGDLIQAGQVIAEIETDKAAMDVEAADSGRLARIVAKEGQVVPVKTPIAYLAQTDADLEAYLSSQGQAVQTAAPEETGTGVAKGQVSTEPAAQAPTQIIGGRVKASPAARKMAAEMGIDLAQVPSGSGPGGRILTTDLQGLKAGPTTTGLSKMRLAIARNLLWSKQNIPHFYAKRIIDANSLMNAYRTLKPQCGCTINDLVVAAVARAVRQFPAFRSQFKEDRIVELSSVNIGIAVGTDQGLTVPVLMDADKLDLKTLAQRTKALVENARAGKLEGVGQGVFTVTNLGMFGIEEFYAIINPPESAILAVGAVRDAVKVIDGSIVPAKVMTLCLSVDHRIIDGVLAAQFLARLAELLEQPEVLVSPKDKG